MPASRVQHDRASEMQSCDHAQTLVGITEMSRRLGDIAVGTLYNLVSQRRIPFWKIGRRLRFDPDEVIRSMPHYSTIGSTGKR